MSKSKNKSGISKILASSLKAGDMIINYHMSGIAGNNWIIQKITPNDGADHKTHVTILNEFTGYETNKIWKKDFVVTRLNSERINVKNKKPQEA